MPPTPSFTPKSVGYLPPKPGKLTTVHVYKTMREYFERKDRSVRDSKQPTTEYYRIKQQEYNSKLQQAERKLLRKMRRKQN